MQEKDLKVFLIVYEKDLKSYTVHQGVLIVLLKTIVQYK